MSYTKLTETIFYGIHPRLVCPDFLPANYVILCPEVERMSEGEIQLLDGGLFSEQADAGKLLEQPISARVYYYDLPDRCAPDPHTLLALVEEISALKGTIYIACRGGHGRSGVVAAALYRLDAVVPCTELLAYVTGCWRRDRDMSYLRPLIRKLGSPQTASQKRILGQYCELLELRKR